MKLFQRKQRASRTVRRCHLNVESLEARQLLAGDVLASVTGSTLSITGDATANEIVISESSGTLQVTGLNGTNVTTDGNFNRVRTISIDLHEGDDSIEVRDATLSRNLLVGGGAGSKSIVIDNVTVRELLIENNAAAHSVSVNDARVLRNLTLVTGAGDSVFSVSDTDVTGKIALRREVDGGPIGTSQVDIVQSELKDLRITDPNSDTTVQVTDSTLLGQIIVTDGTGTFELDIDGSTVKRGANIYDEVGNFWMNADATDFDGSVWIRLEGAGTHSFALQNSHISGNFSMNSKQGISSVYLEGDASVSRTLSLNEEGGASSTLVMADTSYVGTKLRHTIVGGGDNETLLRDNAVVDGKVQASNYEGHSNLRIIENAEVDGVIGSGYVQSKNVEFANRDGAAILADVYVPNSDGPHPTVVLVHGGYWRFGSKAAMAAEAKDLAQRGYVAIAINYRLAPADKFPAQIHDVKSAIMWARENAATYDIDTDNIGLFGYSAGAHLALLAGLTDPSAGLEGPDAGPFSSEVKAIVAGAPGTDFRDVPLNDPRFEFLFGGTRAELPDTYAAASPTNWISSDDPATFIFVGENDTVIDQSNLADFQQGLEDAGVENDSYVSPGQSHLRAAGDRTARLYSLRFLDGQLK
jgi:triacylglycerol lipase